MSNNSSKQVLLSVIGVAILVVAVVGVSFAFFSYTTTGETPNTVKTGSIIFTASTDSLALTNVFPTQSAYTGDGEIATVSINGNTTYAEGIDFVVRAINVANADATNKIIPTITVTAANVPDKVTFTDHYTGNTITGDTVLCRGHINPNQEVALTDAITITAFYDRTKYHITDNTLEAITNAGIKPDYVTGATTLVKPADWNALSADGKTAYSFKIQINATQGTAGRLQ